MEATQVLRALFISSLLMISSPAFSQSVNDLTGQAVTPEELITVLRPKEGPPADDGRRYPWAQFSCACLQALPQGGRTRNYS